MCKFHFHHNARCLIDVLSLHPSSINATITDHAGHDITSSFKIMLFEEPSPIPPANLSTRNFVPALSRPIDHCHGHGGVTVFISSECKPEDGVPGSLQAYKTTCHRMVEPYDPWTGTSDGPFAAGGEYPTFRDGHCADSEICVDGLGVQRSRSGHRMASCVSTQSFVHLAETMLSANRSRDKSRLRTTELEGKMLNMMFSDSNGNTPLEADTLSAKPIFASDHLGADGEGAAFHDDSLQKCRDCMGLETQQFQKGVEGLKTQVRLLTTGAAAGILWLALVSG